MRFIKNEKSHMFIQILMLLLILIAFYILTKKFIKWLLAKEFNELERRSVNSKIKYL